MQGSQSPSAVDIEVMILTYSSQCGLSMHLFPVLDLYSWN